VVASILGVHLKTVVAWRDTLESQGIAEFLAPKTRNRVGKVHPDVRAKIISIVLETSPLTHGFDGKLWIREYVVKLLQERFGVSISLSTATELLRGAGLSPQRPVRRSYKQDRKEVEKWMTESFPEVARKAKAENAFLAWLDESHIESENNYGRTWGQEGETPIVESSGERFAINLIGAMGITGELDIMTFQGRCDSGLVIKYLESLMKKHDGTKLIIVMDNAKYHTSAAIRAFCLEHTEEIELVYQPKYAPELNPIELVWGNIKCHNISKSNMNDRSTFESGINEICSSLMANTELVMSLFGKKELAYILAA
jgi:transposase